MRQRQPVSTQEQGSRTHCPDGEIGRRSGLKIRRPQGRGGSSPPPGTSKIKQFLPPVGLRQSGSHPLVGSGYWIAEVEVIRLQRTVRDGMKRAYGIEALWGGGCPGIPRR